MLYCYIYSKSHPKQKQAIFGFQSNQGNIEKNPILRMGLMVHGLRIVQMIDEVLNWLGPDVDVLNEILSDLGNRHGRYGVKKEHFVHMGEAIRGALSNILDEKHYTKEIFDTLSLVIVQSMP
jgi:hemoglobin-like flavoprotein